MEFLNNPASKVPDVGVWLADMRASISPLGEWATLHVRQSVSDRVALGNATSCDNSLYGHFQKWTREHQVRPSSRKVFVDDLRN